MATKDISDAQVVEACLASRHPSSEGESALEVLMVRTGRSRKECLRAFERAERRGWIDYGVGIHRAFPTEAGEALLSNANLDVKLWDEQEVVARSGHDPRLDDEVNNPVTELP